MEIDAVPGKPQRLSAGVCPAPRLTRLRVSISFAAAALAFACALGARAHAVDQGKPAAAADVRPGEQKQADQSAAPSKPGSNGDRSEDWLQLIPWSVRQSAAGVAPQAGGNLWDFATFGDVTEPRLNLDLRGVGAKEAFRKIFELAKQDYEVDPSVTDSAPITLVMPNIKLSTAIRVAAEATGLSCTVTTFPTIGADPRRYKLRFHVTKTPPGKAPTFVNFVNAPRFDPEAYKAWRDSFTTVRTELDRDEIVETCPHCKRSVTLVRIRVQPRCSKCGRLFQPSWQYCPYDGTRRPAVPRSLRFCPYCGAPFYPRGDDTER